ncbi:MAG TPA: cation:proton antiporter family protein [Noviherbaspirillum sp.]|nr:cation:proton antiporter family protein [Noviherbaspirillum sp.]
MTNVYYQFALLLLAATVVGALALRLRQPLIVAFIIVGIGLGPSGLDLVTAHEEVNLLAQIGVTVLLFVVGLKLDLHMVRNVGPVALATGLGQLLFTIVIGFGITIALGMPALTALYVAVALTFSSTIIIVKLLSDKREVDALHGRIAVGFLIVQDIAVVVAMLLLGSAQAGEGTDASALWILALTVALKIAAAIALVALLMRYVLPRLLRLLAQSQDLLLIFAVAWGTVLAASGDMFGFSKEVGAFLAGFSLASTPYREAIASRLSGLRDFLLLFFFIDMGSHLDLRILGDQMGAAIILSLFVLIGNPLIVMAIMGYMGYRKRTGFLAGLTVAQISEFSIVFVAMGISLGHIAQQALGLVTLVGLVTITLSTYLILYSYPLYTRLAPYLGWFERKEPFREQAIERQHRDETPVDVIVFGAGRFGRRLLHQLRARGYSVLGVDFDPDAVQSLRADGIPVHYGDAEDAELASTLPLAGARWVVSTLAEADANRLLMQVVRDNGFKGKTAIALRSPHHEEFPSGLVVDKVFRPFDDAADFAMEEIAQSLGPDTTSQQRKG